MNPRPGDSKAQAATHERVTLEFRRNALMASLTGNQSRNLVRLEQKLGVKLAQRGNLIAGDSVTVAEDADAALAWMRGELVFDNRPLTEVLPAVSRRYDVDLRADSALSRRRVTARFAAQTLDQVMNALAVSLDVRIEKHGRTLTLTPTLR